jgi:hypothetical protein
MHLDLPVNCPLAFWMLLTVLLSSCILFSALWLLSVLSNSLLIFYCSPLFCPLTSSWTPPGSGLKCPRVGRKEIADCLVWSVIVDSLPRKRESATSLISRWRRVTLETCPCLVTAKHVTISLVPYCAEMWIWQYRWNGPDLLVPPTLP